MIIGRPVCGSRASIVLIFILKTDEILHATLPEDLCDGSPSGFAMTGHIGTGGSNIIEQFY